MTQLKDRCGDCSRFPGNGEKCKCDQNLRNRVYALDYKCKSFLIGVIECEKAQNIC